jgi:MFS family permease
MDGLEARDPDRRAAHVVTELTSPTILAPSLLLAVALYDAATRSADALLWGAVAAIFTGAVPLAFLKYGARTGRWDDHHVHRRESRWLPLTFAIASVVVGLFLLAFGHAPRDLTILVIAMLAGLGSVLIVSHWWKISIHAAVAGGATVVLGAVFGVAGAAIGLALLLAASWARTASADHTRAQVLVGAVLGGCVAATVFICFGKPSERGTSCGPILGSRRPHRCSRIFVLERLVTCRIS